MRPAPTAGECGYASPIYHATLPGIRRSHRAIKLAPAMNVDLLLSALVTLLVTVDPIGLAPIFLSLTHHLSPRQRNGVAMRASLISFGILSFFAMAGERVLQWLGIELPAFRIEGGSA